MVSFGTFNTLDVFLLCDVTLLEQDMVLAVLCLEFFQRDYARIFFIITKRYLHVDYKPHPGWLTRIFGLLCCGEEPVVIYYSPPRQRCPNFSSPQPHHVFGSTSIYCMYAYIVYVLLAVFPFFFFAWRNMQRNMAIIGLGLVNIQSNNRVSPGTRA